MEETTEKTSLGLGVVAIGASAGGLEALSTFLEHAPSHTGLAFVVITHQAEDQPSLLAGLLARHTEMPVVEVEDGMALLPDRVHVTPPGKRVALLNRALHVLGPSPEGKPTLIIDYLFRSVAADVGHRAVAVVLSGTGTDGTLGAQAIKGAAGMVLAQDPETAAHDGMPRSAIDHGVVDHVLAADAMGGWLASYAAGVDDVERSPVIDGLQATQQKLFVLIRDHTGHDFSHYKASTIRRRIERRMLVHHLRSARDYLTFLEKNAHEIELLFRELLIGVTSFFRDREAFDALATALDEVFRTSRSEAPFRVWVAGCSTGEEAYSIAMLLVEAAAKASSKRQIQVFATDLDPRAIDAARVGAYPTGIAADVSEERLARFFTETPTGYRVQNEIRDVVVFAPQNLLSDPPFIRLDLLSCRNLLIYLEADIQSRLLPMFHHALNPDGLLFLGTSEGLGTAKDLFAPVNQKVRLFKKKGGGHRPSELPVLPRLSRELTAGMGEPLRHPTDLGEVTVRLLTERFVPPSVLVDPRGNILYVHGRTGRFLELPPGRPGYNLFQMARDGLRIALSGAVRQAATSEVEAVHHGMELHEGGHVVHVDLVVRRITLPEALRGLVLVSFVVAAEPDYAANPAADAESERLAHLERELRFSRESLQSTVEELETTNEELKSTNEEFQSTNEELQSANEELETSKEEMQSLNEELRAVNAELMEKIDDLSQVNDDMSNLLNSTDIATVFLDLELKITRFTPMATRVIRLIDTDVGRPVGDLVSILGYTTLEQDAATVIREQASKTAEVQADGGFYQIRLLPYRTTDGVVDGVVITFVDITEVKSAQVFADRILEAMPVPLLVVDAELRVTAANAAWRSLATGVLALQVGETIAAPAFADETVHQLQDALATIGPVVAIALHNVGLDLRVTRVDAATSAQRPHLLVFAEPSGGIHDQNQ